MRDDDGAVTDGVFAIDPPTLDERGVSVSATIRPDPGVERGAARIALSHGEDATGWWIGLGGDGRVIAGLGTVSGPVSVSAGDAVAEGQSVDVVVHLPGTAGDRLELDVYAPNAAAPARASVVVGARMLAPRGPIWCGARSVRDGRSIQPLRGTVSRPVVVARKHPGNLGGGT